MKKSGKKVTVESVLKSSPKGLSLKEIDKKTGFSEREVEKRLQRLEKKGIVGDDGQKMKKEKPLVKKKAVKTTISKKQKAKLLALKKKADKLKQKELGKAKVGVGKKKLIGGKKTFGDVVKEKNVLKGLIGKPSKKEENVGKEEPVKGKKGKIDVAAIAAEIKQEQISKQRAPVEDFAAGKPLKVKGKAKEPSRYIKTGVPGFDELLYEGIPKGNAMIIAGGAGSGKTIFCMQTLVNKAKEGKKCLIMTLEEREDKLIQHMEDFGWPARQLVKKGNLKVQRMNPFDITRNVDALLAKQKGELLIDIDPIILPKDFQKPDFVCIDSLTAIASAFTGKDESYRIYIEQLFRFLEKTGATSLLITETEQVPKIFSPTGVEEFLADGVVVLYALKHGNVRENALEILKLRGAAHQKKIVAMQISGQGLMVYPEQEVFSEI